MRRQLGLHKVIVNFIHQRFDRTGSIRGRGMAMDPSLRMNDVGDRMSRAAHGIAAILQFRDQRFDPVLVIEKKFNVVTAGEAQIAVAVFFRDVADFTDVIR